MSLTIKEVQHLADLARLEISAEEAARFTQQLAGVLDYVDKIQSLVGQADSVQTEAVTLRSDEVIAWPAPERLIQLAPEHDDGLINVPEVFADRE